MEKGTQPYKIVFSRWSSKNEKKWKKRFLAKVAWHYLEKTRIFVCTIQIVVSAELPKTKNDTFFFEKGVFFFDMGEKVGFTNCVFEKLCSSENTIFIVLSAKHSSCNKKAVFWRKQRIYEIVGCFWACQKGVFCLFFWGF